MDVPVDLRLGFLLLGKLRLLLTNFKRDVLLGKLVLGLQMLLEIAGDGRVKPAHVAFQPVGVVVVFKVVVKVKNSLEHLIGWRLLLGAVGNRSYGEACCIRFFNILARWRERL